VSDDRGRPDVDRDGVPLPTEPPGELAEVYPLHPPTGYPGVGPPAGHGGLLVEDLGAVLDRVQAAGRPGWLVEGLWPADAYGVLAAEDKAGKTWAILDLAVSVAAGRPWLGAYPCPQAGRVLVFLGEATSAPSCGACGPSAPTSTSRWRSWPPACGCASASPA